jgi:hypothetical protein
MISSSAEESACASNSSTRAEIGDQSSQAATGHLVADLAQALVSS